MIQMAKPLTQAEMDELHAYATAKGIGLIAAVNSPDTWMLCWWPWKN